MYVCIVEACFFTVGELSLTTIRQTDRQTDSQTDRRTVETELSRAAHSRLQANRCQYRPIIGYITPRDRAT